MFNIIKLRASGLAKSLSSFSKSLPGMKTTRRPVSIAEMMRIHRPLTLGCLIAASTIPNKRALIMNQKPNHQAPVQREQRDVRSIEVGSTQRQLLTSMVPIEEGTPEIKSIRHVRKVRCNCAWSLRALSASTNHRSWNFPCTMSDSPAGRRLYGNTSSRSAVKSKLTLA